MRHCIQHKINWALNLKQLKSNKPISQKPKKRLKVLRKVIYKPSHIKSLKSESMFPLYRITFTEWVGYLQHLQR